MVADDLGGQLLGGVGDRSALVDGQLRADDDWGVLFLVGEVDAYPAPSAARGGVDVVGGQVHGGMISADGSFPSIFPIVPAGTP